MKTKNILSGALGALAILATGVFAGHPELPLNLGSAGDFVILAKSGISTDPASNITGDMGASPVTATAITGFGLMLDASTDFSTSAQVTGRIYAKGYSPSTDVKMTSAIGDMETAYTTAAGRPLPDTNNLGATAGSDKEIGGLTFVPGLHKWTTGVLISTQLTLDAEGDPNAVFIFQIEGNLTIASAQKVVLAGGAQAKNIFWQVAGGAGAIINTTAHFEGVILTATGINVLTGATFNGKLLAQTDVNLQGNTIVDSDLINQYTLIYTADPGGSILGNSPQFVMAGEDGTQVSAVASNGFVFVLWSDLSIDNPRTDLNVMEDIRVRAIFAASNQYTLVYTAGLGGSILGVSPQVVNGGEDGTQVSAVADPGFQFVQWSDASTDNPRTDTNVTEDITVEATFEALPLDCGILVTLGAVSENDLSAMFVGSNLVYAVDSGDPTVMEASITAGNELRTVALALGDSLITVTASNTVSALVQTNAFNVRVVGNPTTVGIAFETYEPWNPRFTQNIAVRNDDACDAIGLRLLFSDLQPGIVPENQTGVAPAPDGRPMIEIKVDFPPGATQTFAVVYLATGAFRPDLNPPTVEVQYILADAPPAALGLLGPTILRLETLPDGRTFLEFDSVPGNHYRIELMDGYPGGDWITVALDLMAGANRTQWIDHGPPATPPVAGTRVYRVLQDAN